MVPGCSHLVLCTESTSIRDHVDARMVCTSEVSMNHDYVTNAYGKQCDYLQKEILSMGMNEGAMRSSCPRVS